MAVETVNAPQGECEVDSGVRRGEEAHANKDRALP